MSNLLRRFGLVRQRRVLGTPVAAALSPGSARPDSEVPESLQSLMGYFREQPEQNGGWPLWDALLLPFLNAAEFQVKCLCELGLGHAQSLACPLDLVRLNRPHSQVLSPFNGTHYTLKVYTVQPPGPA